MNWRNLVLSVLLLSLSIQQALAENKPDLVDHLRGHVYFLADDSLEGRISGSVGEEIAAEYISNRLSEIGLTPAFSEDWRQPFQFRAGKNYGPSTLCTYHQESLTLMDDFYVLNISGNGAIQGRGRQVGFGIVNEDQNDFKESGFKQGEIALIDIGFPEGTDPHAVLSLQTELKNRAKNAIDHGAIAVVFINLDPGNANPRQDFQTKIAELKIPAIFIKDHIVKTYDSELVEISMVVEMEKVDKTAHNVAGWIDNGADKTVVIGGHYDHLGHGEYGGSRYRGEAQIHNGADDNASGIAVMIELARFIQMEKLTNHNYLFVGFSGEELGLFGSKYFVENSPVTTSSIHYMINMDMIGRLENKSRGLAINGLGTTPNWPDVIESANASYDINLKLSESGIGPSDHTSFYKEDVPVLHFFTGSHDDYHKPQDDADKLNYRGMATITKFMMEIIRQADEYQELPFTKTKEDDNKNVPRFTVTLGIMPDYMYDKNGMRIDAVTEGKTANVAGIEKGDIVLGIGEYEVTDMFSYMDALSKYKRGDKAMVKILRDDKPMEMEVTFQ